MIRGTFACARAVSVSKEQCWGESRNRRPSFVVRGFEIDSVFKRPRGLRERVWRYAVLTKEKENEGARVRRRVAGVALPVAARIGLHAVGIPHAPSCQQCPQHYYHESTKHALPLLLAKGIYTHVRCARPAHRPSATTCSDANNYARPHRYAAQTSVSSLQYSCSLPPPQHMAAVTSS